MPFHDSFYYESHGDDKRPVAVFLHGFLGSGSSWQEIIDELNKAYYCIRIDLPGHGKSKATRKSEFSMAHCAKNVVGLLAHLNLKKYHLIGYSLGGRLALFIALNYGMKIDKLVLESSSPGLKTKKERLERKKSDEWLARELEKGSFKQFLEEWYSQPLFESLKNDKKRFPALLKQRLKNDPLELGKSLRYMGTGVQPSLWGKLENLRPPTLLIVGEHDRKFQLIASEMSSQSKKITVNCVTGAGHNVHFEKPGQFASVLKNFLN